jgi:hypothetical protein
MHGFATQAVEPFRDVDTAIGETHAKCVERLVKRTQRCSRDSASKRRSKARNVARCHKLLFLQPPVTAIVAKDPEFIGESTLEKTAVHHHARVACRWNRGRDERAEGEIDIADANELFASEWDFEMTGRDLELAKRPPIDEDIAPPAKALEVAFDLKLDVIRNLAIDAGATYAKVEFVLWFVGFEDGVEYPIVKLKLETEIDAHVLAELYRRAVPPIHASARAIILLLCLFLLLLLRLRDSRQRQQHDA